MKKVIPNPLKVVFRQAPNLKQRLVKSSFKALPFTNREDVEEEIAGCYRYLHGRMGRPCVTCPRISESTHFSSTYTQQRYKMRHRLSCKSSFVVYLITCMKPHNNQTGVCGSQYIGSTTVTMALRHAGHRTEIKNQSSPFGQHFHDCGMQNLSLQVIDCVKQGEKEALELLEGFWQHRLATFKVHNNLNDRDELKRKQRS